MSANRAAIEHAVANGRAPFWWGAEVRLDAADLLEIWRRRVEAARSRGGAGS